METGKSIKIVAGAFLVFVLVGSAAYLATMLLFGFEIFTVFCKRFNQPELYAANFWNFWAALLVNQILNLLGFNFGFNRLFPITKFAADEARDRQIIKLVMAAGLCFGTLLLILLRQDQGFYNTI